MAAASRQLEDEGSQSANMQSMQHCSGGAALESSFLSLKGCVCMGGGALRTHIGSAEKKSLWYPSKLLNNARDPFKGGELPVTGNV